MSYSLFAKSSQAGHKRPNITWKVTLWISHISHKTAKGTVSVTAEVGNRWMKVSSFSSYPLWVFDKIASTGSLVDPLGVDPLLYGSLGLSDDLSELGILWELVPVWFPRRATTVPVQKRLSLPAATRTAGRDANHRARCASKRAPGAGGLCGTVAEITGVPERRDKRTRLVHDSGGGRGVILTPGKSEERKQRRK